MLWTLQVIDRENGFVRLINVASGTFAQPASFGSGLVGSHHPWICKIVPRNNLGEYSIQTTNGELACSLADANDHTQVTLQGTDNNNHTQGWIFCSA